MTAKPSFPASAKSAAPKSIFPTPTVRKRSTPSDCFLCPRSFDVLYLLPQFFDFRFDFEAYSGNGKRFVFDARRLREHRIRLPMHFLQKKIQFLAKFSSPVEQLSKLLQMAAQTI
jgi:hypothetical protein